VDKTLHFTYHVYVIGAKGCQGQ